MEDIKRTIRQGLDNLPGYYKYQQGQKQGGKYYSPGLTPLLPIEALGAGFKSPEEYKKKHGEYPSGYSKPPRRLDPSNTVPAGSMNVSPPGSTRRKEVEAQIKRDNAARKMQMTSEHLRDIVEGKYSDSVTYKKGTAPKYDPRTGERYYSEPYQKKGKV